MIEVATHGNILIEHKGKNIVLKTNPFLSDEWEIWCKAIVSPTGKVVE